MLCVRDLVDLAMEHGPDAMAAAFAGLSPPREPGTAFGCRYLPPCWRPSATFDVENSGSGSLFREEKLPIGWWRLTEPAC